MRILFLYTGGRQRRLESSVSGFPKEFFYGYHEFQKRGYSVDFVERVIPKEKPLNLRYRWLDYHNQWAVSQLTMGNNAPFFLRYLERMKKADVIIAIGDSIALAPEYYKLRGWIDAKIIHVSMGFLNYWQSAKSDIFSRIGLRRFYYERLLRQSDSIVTLGEAEYQLFGAKFPVLRDKLRFIPFGVDIDFWKPSDLEVKDIDVLFIGNDMRRDYQLLEQLPKRLPNLNFTYVSKRIPQSIAKECRNVTLYSGSWRSLELSDEKIRELYHRSKVLINPICDTLQPSGQSVTLQASACGLPVLISKFEGFWQPSNYSKKNIFFVNHTLEEWIDAVQVALRDEDLRLSVGRNGCLLTRQHYSTSAMVSEYEKILKEFSLNDI